MRYDTVLKDIVLIAFVALSLQACVEKNSRNVELKEKILKTKGIVALCDFREEEGQNRLAYGDADFHLQEKSGSIPRVEEEPLSSYSARFGDGAYLIFQ